MEQEQYLEPGTYRVRVTLELTRDVGYECETMAEDLIALCRKRGERIDSEVEEL